MSVLETERPTAPAAGLPPAPLLAPGLPSLRLLPVPVSEPPYDDELTAVPQLRLVPSAPLVDLQPAEQPRHRVGQPAPARLRGLPLDDDEDDARTPTSALPSPRPFAHALVQRLLEVAAGVRPVAQLQRDTSVELFAELERTLNRRPRPAGPRPNGRSVRSVHVQTRPDGVAEVCATVQREGRARALALRLEGRNGAWRCTELVGV